MQVDDNVVFVLNSSRNVVYFNDNAKKAFPSMQTGKTCMECTGSSHSRCQNCPVVTNSSETVPLFSLALSRWLTMSFGKMDYPGQGECTVVTGTLYNSLRKEILSRAKFMNKYDFIMEMNLTIDRYLMISDETFGNEIALEEEPLSVLIKRTAETMVHPDDYKKFIRLLDLSTLEERLKAAKFPLTDVVRERNTRGTFDEVTITIIPEELPQDDHVMVMALFHIENLKSRASHSPERDTVTGLLHKDSFMQVSQDFMKQYHDETCVIYLDIEHFRLFNKWYSRWQGDRLLKSIGLFLLQMDRMFSTVSGYGGGDDFFILCDKQDVVLDYLVNGINEIIKSFDGIEGFRMAYGGYTLKNNNEDLMDALDLASIACSQDITLSADKIRWYDEKITREEEAEQRLLPDIERGLEEGEFTFFLQPKCSIRENRIVGAEALVRWKHKIRGFVSPGEFIPVLEKKGMIAKLDSYIWEEVCRKLSQWQKTGLELVPVSVNVSRIDIYSMNVPDIFAGLIEKYKIDPELIEIEITESAFVDDSRIMRSVISRLRALGLKILIDDFGSGYSSLNMLKDVQADVLKMDIKFFDLKPDNFDKGLNIISSVLEMSHSIGLPVIAEGVETKAQIELLESIGFNYVQGYCYYKPLKLEDYEKIISEEDNISHSGIGIF